MLRSVLLIVFFLLHFESVFAIEKLNILGLFKGKAIVQIDGKQRLLTVGEKSPEGVILISANSREAILEIEGERNTYTIGAHISGKFNKPKSGTISTIAPDSNGMYWANGSINGFQVSFVVDTGATLIAMNRHQARRIGLNYKLEGRVSSANTASGVSKIYIINLDKVKVGDIELKNVEGAVHDSDFPKIILLGNSFLNRVSMKREGRILQLEGP